MIIQLRIIAGLLYIAIVRIEITFCAKECKVENLKADCSSRGFDDIPQTLDMNLIELNASYNPIAELTADTFKRYPKLLTLDLRGVAPNDKRHNGTSYKPTVFVPLKELVNLDISESGFHVALYATEFIWPTTLQILSVNSMKYFKFLSLNLTSLSRLEELNARRNDLRIFPSLHPQAPIIWIDFRENPWDNVTAEDLAPYCLLKTFLITVTGDGKLNLATGSCTCRRLEAWMLVNKIRGFEFNCQPPRLAPDETDPCQVKIFSDKMWEQRKECFDRQPWSPFWKGLIIVALLCLIVPAIWCSIEGYKYYMRRKGKTASDDSAAASSSDDAATSSDANDEPPTENQESAD
ncbi:uncharacterized protein LOC135834763 [Planococcus citri]|uniref:uncharacterized protein LOC135834763 n=1 Tax=Planococcus citri TaxID=170843 RepID=UPI0031FA44CC